MPDTAATAPETSSSRRERRNQQARANRRTTLRNALFGVAFVLLVAVIRSTLVTQYAVPSISMEDTLLVGDRIIVNRTTADESDLHRGDVVVFEQPPAWGGGVSTERPSPDPLINLVRDLVVGNDQYVVKRIIGLPGDKVVCCNEKAELTVNGQPVSEPYIQGQAGSLSPFNITVPRGRVWVMGDNRKYSADSRRWDDGNGSTGSVRIERIQGQVVGIAWPPSRMGALDTWAQQFESVPNPTRQ